jgi:hypothetical protein
MAVLTLQKAYMIVREDRLGEHSRTELEFCTPLEPILSELVERW